MRTVVVASKNPVKIACVGAGFARMFPGEHFDVRGASVASGVGHQPMGDAETLHGAECRARNALAAFPEAEYWVGIEGGCEDRDGGFPGNSGCFPPRPALCRPAKRFGLHGFAWVVVLSRDRQGCSRTASFEIPPKVAELVRRGVELGHADDQVFGRTNSKEGNGAVGLLTGDVVDRVTLYEPAVVLALIPFRNPGLFPTA